MSHASSSPSSPPPPAWRLFRALSLGATLLALGVSTPAAIRVVSPTGGTGAGTVNDPWSLAHANANLQPGDTAQLRAGNYDDLIQPANANGTNEAGRITYTNFPGDATPHVRGKAGTLMGATVDVAGEDYVTVSNLNVSSDKTASFANGACVVASNSLRFILRNCEVTKPFYLNDPRLTDGLASTGLPQGAFQSGVGLGNSQFALIENCTVVGWKDGIGLGMSTNATIRNCVIQNNWDSQTTYGNNSGAPLNAFLLFEGNHIGGGMVEDAFQTNAAAPSEIRKIVFRNNYFYYNGEDALDFKGGHEILVEGNVFAGTAGDNDGYAFNSGRAPNTTWQTVEHFSGGISRGAGTLSSQVVIRRNVFYDNNYGVALIPSSTNWKCYNNTFAANNRDFLDGWNGTDDTIVPHKAMGGLSANGFAFVNNISMDHMNCEVYRETSTATGVLDHNLYSSATPAGLRFAQSPNANTNANDPMNQQTIFAGANALANWRAHLNTLPSVQGREANSVQGLPQFVSVDAYPNLRFNFKRANPVVPVYPPVITLALRATWFPYDFNLVAGSPGIDAGGFLTTTTNAGTGTVVSVGDARYFTDGLGVIPGDTVQIGTDVVQVTALNYAANTLTVTPAITWAAGEGVSLPYSGSAPDIGAFEFTGGSAPAAPATLTATATSSNQVDLSWPDVAGETGYRIQRKVGTGAYSDLTTKAADSTAHPDSTVAPDTTYTYQIRAENGNGFSAYTQSDPVMTPPGGGGTPVVHEAESLANTLGAGTAQTVADANASPAGGGGQYHLFEPTAGSEVGSFVTYTVNVATAGTYDVATGITTRNNRGIYQLKIDNVNQGAAQDYYTAGATTQFAERNLGAVTLSAGAHAFRFECTGKNASASQFKQGLDYIKLTPQSTNSVPDITTTTLPGTITGEAYSQTLAATGGDGALVWSISAGALPAGLSLSTAGVISGNATAAGTANFTVRVADSDGVTGAGDEDTQALSIVVTANSVPVITTTTLPDGTVGTAYSQTLAATGGNGALAWSLDSGALPAGLSLSSGGVISGTPTTAATSNFTVRVADSDGVTDAGDEDTQALGLVVNSAGGPVTHEAESLTVAANSDTVQVVADASASNGEYHLLNGSAAGSFVTYTVNVATAGTYDVATMITTRSNRGIYQLQIDGVNQGAPQDYYTAGATTLFAERALGAVTLSAGNHAFRFECTGKNASASQFKQGLDYIKLTPVLTTLLEAESLTFVVGSGTSQIVADANASPAGGGGEYHLLEPTAGSEVGSFVTYTVNVATAGAYNITTGVTTRNNRGIYQLKIDNVNQGAAQNYYAAGATTLFGERDLGNVTLTAGAHAFRFECTGKDAGASQFKQGLDYLKLTKL